MVAACIPRALTVLPPERLVVAPDCGMKYLTRDLAFRKLEAMVAGTRLVREELGVWCKPASRFRRVAGPQEPAVQPCPGDVTVMSRTCSSQEIPAQSNFFPRSGYVETAMVMTPSA